MTQSEWEELWKGVEFDAQENEWKFLKGKVLTNGVCENCRHPLQAHDRYTQDCYVKRVKSRNLEPGSCRCKSVRVDEFQGDISKIRKEMKMKGRV